MSVVVVTFVVCITFGVLLIVGIKGMVDEGEGNNSLYVEAMNEVSSGSLESAEEKLKESLAENPEHTESAVQLLEVYGRQGKEQAQVSLCRNLLKLYDAGQQDFQIEHVQLKLADILWSQAKYEECFFHYAQVLQKEKEPRVMARVGYILASQGRFEQAMSLFGQALASDPYDKDANRGQVLCQLGRGRFEDARDGLLDAMADNSATNLDSYLLARTFRELGDLQSAQNYYMDFLLQLESKNSMEGYEALMQLVPVYEEKGAKLGRRELDVWYRVFHMCLDRMFLRPKLKHRILFHETLIAILRDFELEDFTVARESLERMERIELKLELEKSICLELKTGLDEGWSLERWQQIFMQNRLIDRTLFSNTQPFDVRNYFEIPPINPKRIDQIMSPGFLRSVKTQFESGGELDSSELAQMSAQRFRTRMLAGLKELGYEYRAAFPSDAAGTALYFRMRVQGKGELLVAAYRSTGDLGELEVQEVLNLMNENKLHKALLITMGNLSADAERLASQKGVECYTGSQFQDKVRRAA